MIAAVRRVYDIADKEGEKPPNIREVAEPVQESLKGGTGTRLVPFKSKKLQGVRTSQNAGGRVARP